jgi:uroporphyrin-III C-methyltransferase
MRGTVYLVGAGPGDPDLLTVGALRALETADVILHDRLVSAEILALAAPSALLVDVGKEEGQQEAIQDRILALLVSYAARFATVVRLKGGDPMVFGRGAEEWQWLAERGVPVRVVPGVSSSIAGPAGAAIPLTYRGLARSFAVISGHDRADLAETFRGCRGIDTLVILMGIRTRAAIASALVESGRRADLPVAFVEHATTPRERVIVTTLSAVAAGLVAVQSPAVFVVGEVVSKREELLALAAVSQAA